jgi:hypothetical protein
MADSSLKQFRRVGKFVVFGLRIFKSVAMVHYQLTTDLDCPLLTQWIMLGEGPQWINC